MAKSENVSSNPLKNEEFLDAFENYALLQSRQATIAASLALPLNDPGVIKQLFLDKKNAELAHSIAMQIAGQEQGTVQDIYAANLVEIMLDPTLSSIGHLFQLDEIRILDKSFVFSDYVKNPADIEQRLKFAEVLFKAAEKGFGEGQFPEYQEKVLQAAEQTLWWGNPYVAPLKSSEANNAYWGQQAEKYDKALKEKVSAFFSLESSIDPSLYPECPLFSEDEEIRLFDENREESSKPMDLFGYECPYPYELQIAEIDGDGALLSPGTVYEIHFAFLDSEIMEYMTKEKYDNWFANGHSSCLLLETLFKGWDDFYFSREDYDEDSLSICYDKETGFLWEQSTNRSDLFREERAQGYDEGILNFQQWKMNDMMSFDLMPEIIW